MNTPEALYALGVRDDTLTEAERAKLDTDGFLPLPGILTPSRLRRSPAGWRHCWKAKASMPAKRFTRKPAPTGCRIWSTKIRSSRSASRIRASWPGSRMCSITISGSPR